MARQADRMRARVDALARGDEETAARLRQEAVDEAEADAKRRRGEAP